MDLKVSGGGVVSIPKHQRFYDHIKEERLPMEWSFCTFALIEMLDLLLVLSQQLIITMTW